jgi:hypothetical protein
MSRRYKPYMEERIEPDGTLSITELPWNTRRSPDEPSVAYGCAQLGPRRFAWLVSDFHNWLNEAPDAFGYADSLEEAERQMTEARKPFTGRVAFRNVGTVRYWHRQLVRRSRKPNHTASDSKPVEYVWSENGEQRPIVKKTAKRIFIKGPHDFEEACHVVDRQPFEQTGKARTSGRRGYGETYYREPPRGDWGAEYTVPDCLRTFGLTGEATVEQLQAAYRREVKTAHPDQGGTSEGFHALRQAYEQAQQLLRRNAPNVA